MYQKYKQWKGALIAWFNSAQATKSEKIKSNFIQFYSGNEGRDLIAQWRIEGKIYNPEDHPAAGEGEDPDPPIPDGALNDELLSTYWTMFDAYFRPKTNVLLAQVLLK